MQRKELFMLNKKTILQQIGVTDNEVQTWLKKGLKITYPMLKNKKYYKSEDGVVFVENGDKYVPHFSKRETRLYTRDPKQFRKDFLKNVRFYVNFINWLHKLQPKTVHLEPKKRFTSLLLLLYLFQRGMDYHYYHFDRYLVYQNYPDTPVGFWWNKLKQICKPIAKKFNIDEIVVLIDLLSHKPEIINKYSQTLNKRKIKELIKILEKIKIYENAQKEEIEIIIDSKTKENTVFRTGVPIWSDLMDLLKKYPSLVESKFHAKIPVIIEGHPIIMTRIILSPEGLHYFQPEIFQAFKREIKRWI